MSEFDIFQGENVEKAYEIVKEYAHKTPVLTCGMLNEKCGCNVFFKCENFQKIGAFKFRGAIHSCVKMIKDDPKIESLWCKVDAVRGYNANIIFSENNPLSRETLCEEVQKKHKAKFIHPSDEPYEFYGQTKELHGTTLDAVMVPVGGGGLASGTGLAAKYLDKKIKVFGAEPEAANDAFRSFKGGKHVKNTPGVKPKTIADGLLTNLGPNTFHVITNYFDDIFTVNDEQIVEAMWYVWSRMKIVIEPSSAVPVAAALFNKEFRKLGIKNLGIILSGGNIDLTDFFEIVKSKCNQ